MRYLTMLALAAVLGVAATVLVGVGSASGAVLCKEWITPCPLDADYYETEPVHASLEAKTSVEFAALNESVLNTCSESTIAGRVGETGGLKKPASINIEKMTFTGCTSTVDTVSNGKFQIEYAPGINNTIGTLEAVGIQITVSLATISCTYGTGPSLDIGDITSTKSSTYASITINQVFFKEAGSFVCPMQGYLKANYTITSPEPLHVKPKMADE